MKITPDALRAKRSCASGYRWFSRRFVDPAEYQGVLDALVLDGRVSDACWLLDHFGPTATVRAVDSVAAEALVFAGSLELRGGADIGAVLRVGGGIACSDGLLVRHGLQSGAAVRSGMHIDAGWGIVAGDDIVAEGSIRAGECVISAGAVEPGRGYGVYAGLSARREDWPSCGQVRCRSRPRDLLSGFWAG